MLDKIKQEAMKRGMKLMTNPKVMKLMADPRFMNAITRGFELKGRLESEIEGGMRCVASSLRLATQDELQTLKSTLRQMESTVRDLRSQLEEQGTAQGSGGNGTR